MCKLGGVCWYRYCSIDKRYYAAGRLTDGGGGPSSPLPRSWPPLSAVVKAAAAAAAYVQDDNSGMVNKSVVREVRSRYIEVI